MLNTCVVTYGDPEVTETFIRAHVRYLDGSAHLLSARTHDLLSRTPLQRSAPYRFVRKIFRELHLSEIEQERVRAYRSIFQETAANVVLAEYGPTAVKLVEACVELDLPLVAHFHGYDASRHTTLEQYLGDYERVFEVAEAIVAVSLPMREKLIELGAPPEKVYWNPCGADSSLFEPASFAAPDPVFLSVGRFVPKKGPHLTLLAFARVLETHPNARLRMVGEDFLLDACRDLAKALGIEHAVTFLGARPHEEVQAEMQRAWCFVQHSVEAHSGDSEGTPVSVLEAGASALPVVATRHAGIPEVILDGKTGYLVDERDVEAMAERMLRIAGDKAHARQLGLANRKRVLSYYDVRDRVHRLSKILKKAAGLSSAPLPLVPDWVSGSGQTADLATVEAASKK